MARGGGGCIDNVWSLHALVVLRAYNVMPVKVKIVLLRYTTSVSPDINIRFHRIIIVPLLSISMIMKL